MKYIYAFLLFTFLHSSITNAQGGYKSGYVVALSGDTIKGFVGYKDWARNPTEINFKNAVTDTKIERYSIDNIKLFVINGYERYEQYSVKISTAPVSTESLSRGLDTGYKKGNVFLKLITGGNNVDLYEFTDDIKTRYYVRESGKEPVELVYRVYLTSNEGESVSATQRLYRQQLLNLAAIYKPNELKLRRYIESVTYSDDLKKTIDGLNGPKPTDWFASADKINSTRFFAGIGLNESSVKINGYASYSQGVAIGQGIIDLNGYTTFANSSTSLFPLITIGEDFFFNKNIGSLVFRAQLDFTGTLIKFTSTTPENTNVQSQGYYYNSVFTLNQYTASLKPQLLYNFYNKNKLKIYVGAGLSVNYAAYGNKQSYRTYYPSQIVQPQVFTPVQAFYFTAVTKAGFVLNNKVDIHFSFEPPASSAYSSMILTSYQAGVNYFFGK